MRSGQTTVEYLLTISVLCIAIAAVVAGLSSLLTSETRALGSSMAQSLASGDVQR